MADKRRSRHWLGDPSSRRPRAALWPSSSALNYAKSAFVNGCRSGRSASVPDCPRRWSSRWNAAAGVVALVRVNRERAGRFGRRAGSSNSRRRRAREGQDALHAAIGEVEARHLTHRRVDVFLGRAVPALPVRGPCRPRGRGPRARRVPRMLRTGRASRTCPPPASCMTCKEGELPDQFLHPAHVKSSLRDPKRASPSPARAHEAQFVAGAMHLRADAPLFDVG